MSLQMVLSNLLQNFSSNFNIANAILYRIVLYSISSTWYFLNSAHKIASEMLEIYKFIKNMEKFKSELVIHNVTNWN